MFQILSIRVLNSNSTAPLKTVLLFSPRPSSHPISIIFSSSTIEVNNILLTERTKEQSRSGKQVSNKQPPMNASQENTKLLANIDQGA
jgi:hypothetical protein